MTKLHRRMTAGILLLASALPALASAGAYTVRVPLKGLTPSGAIAQALPTVSDGTLKTGACASGAATSCATFGGSLTVTVNTTTPAYTGSVCKSSGKWYFEYITSTFAGSPAIRAPIVGYTNGVAGNTGNGTTNAATYGIGEYYASANKATRITETGIAGSSTYAAGDTVGVALDLDAGTMTLYRYGAANGVVYSGIPAGTYCPAAVVPGATFNNIATANFNFGQQTFANPVPSGYHLGLF